MKKYIFAFAMALASLSMQAQIVVLDPGHGYGSSTSNNPDGRTATEIETALSVGLKTRTLIQNSCNWTVHMTRTTNVNGWTSVNARATASNSWGADRFLSIHCNAGGGTGTETFYCTHDDSNTAPDIAFSNKIQTDMVNFGQWTNRRVADDINYLNYHLGVLRYSSATACLSEIGFVDRTTDAAKLNSDSWRNNFANSYFNSFKSSLNNTCSTSTSKPGAFALTLTTACDSGESFIYLNWTAASGATAYDIYRNGNLYASNVTARTFANNYLITGGTSFSYYVIAKNSAGSTTSTGGTKSITAAQCGAPGAFSLTATATCSGTQSAINLTWTAAAGATSYDIYRNGNLYAENQTGTSFLNTYLINAGTAYTFRIVAKNASGSTNNSNGTLSRTAISCASARMTATESKQLSFYPNPTKDFLNITLDQVLEESATVDVFDIQGKLVVTDVIKANNDEHSLSLISLNTGTYIVRITNMQIEHSFKILKN